VDHLHALGVVHGGEEMMIHHLAMGKHAWNLLCQWLLCVADTTEQMWSGGSIQSWEWHRMRHLCGGLLWGANECWQCCVASICDLMGQLMQLKL